MSQYLSQKNLPYFNLLDQTTDLIWAGNPKSTSNRFNNYYDYYFRIYRYFSCFNLWLCINQNYFSIN